jgi:flagellar biosynthetic protein FlhB
MLQEWTTPSLFAFRRYARLLIQKGFGTELNAEELIAIARALAWQAWIPLLIAAGGILTATLATQLTVTGLGFSLKRMAPKLNRLNPVQKLRDLPRNNIPAMLQALFMLPLFGWLVYLMVDENLGAAYLLPLRSTQSGLAQVGGSLISLLWKASAVFAVFGVVDLLRQKRRHQKELMMSRHEVKEESKESEGDPQIKFRIRRLQRERIRKQMMNAVATATAVVVNPTHYAVAIRYVSETMPAPLVVAKGKNYLALRIKQRALDHQVPLIENAPLAQALYGSVEVGQEIPVHLYRAVAEVLAYIYRIMHGSRP